MASERSG
jgi:hypothetical protein